MFDLTTLIKTRLREIDGVRKRDVFITPHPDYLPLTARGNGVSIGIFGGNEDPEDLAGGITEWTLPVTVFVFGPFSDDEKILSEIDATAKAVHAKLKDHIFPGYCRDVSVGKRTGFQYGVRKSEQTKKPQSFLRKGLSYTYTKEEE